jgi:hypothetical protein
VEWLVAAAPYVSPFGESQADSHQMLPESVLKYVRFPRVIVKHV